MEKYNVKKIENTNTMTTTLTTSCKKRDTAINRFCRFLSEYDCCFKDSMLLCTMKVEFVGYVDGNALYQANVETDEYYMTYTECGDVYHVIIEFKHNENTTHYKSLVNTSVSYNTKENDNETPDNTNNSADCNKETSTDNKTPDELKADINKKYGVNAVYYDNDCILCDSEKQIVNVSYNTSNKTSQTCNIKAYCDGKELSVPYSTYRCVEHALEYMHNLYINRVVSYDTVFIMKCGSQAKEYTIHTLIDITDLIQYNIDDINHGLKHDSYKYVREGVNRICDIITDNMKICIDLDKTQYCTITKSRYDGYYCFKFVKTVYTKKPSDFARWLYTQTFTHRIDLKCWYRD